MKLFILWLFARAAYNISWLDFRMINAEAEHVGRIKMNLRDFAPGRSSSWGAVKSGVIIIVFIVEMDICNIFKIDDCRSSRMNDGIANVF